MRACVIVCAYVAIAGVQRVSDANDAAVAACIVKLCEPVLQDDITDSDAIDKYIQTERRIAAAAIARAESH